MRHDNVGHFGDDDDDDNKKNATKNSISSAN